MRVEKFIFLVFFLVSFQSVFSQKELGRQEVWHFMVRNATRIDDIGRRFNCDIKEVKKLSKLSGKVAMPGKVLFIPVKLRPVTWDPSNFNPNEIVIPLEDARPKKEYELDFDVIDPQVLTDFILVDEMAQDSMRLEKLIKHISKIDKKIKQLNSYVDSLKKAEFAFDYEESDMNSVLKKMEMARQRFYTKRKEGMEIDSLNTLRGLLGQEVNKIDERINDYDFLRDNQYYFEKKKEPILFAERQRLLSRGEKIRSENKHLQSQKKPQDVSVRQPEREEPIVNKATQEEPPQPKQEATEKNRTEHAATPKSSEPPVQAINSADTKPDPPKSKSNLPERKANNEAPATTAAKQSVAAVSQNQAQVNSLDDEEEFDEQYSELYGELDSLDDDIASPKNFGLNPKEAERESSKAKTVPSRPAQQYSQNAAQPKPVSKTETKVTQSQTQTAQQPKSETSKEAKPTSTQTETKVTQTQTQTAQRPKDGANKVAETVSETTDNTSLTEKENIKASKEVSLSKDKTRSKEAQSQMASESNAKSKSGENESANISQSNSEAVNVVIKDNKSKVAQSNSSVKPTQVQQSNSSGNQENKSKQPSNAKMYSYTKESEETQSDLQTKEELTGNDAEVTQNAKSNRSKGKSSKGAKQTDDQVEESEPPSGFEEQLTGADSVDFKNSRELSNVASISANTEKAVVNEISVSDDLAESKSDFKSVKKEMSVDDIFNNGLVQMSPNDVELVKIPQAKDVPRYMIQSDSISRKRAEELFKRFESMMRSKEYKRALSQLEKIIEIDPNNCDYWSYHADFLISAGKELDAMRELNISIKINPDKPKQLLKIGKLYDRTNDFDSAFEYYTYAIMADDSYQDAYYERADLSLRQDDIKTALSDFSNIIAIDKKASKAYLERGTLRMSERNFQGAIEDLDKYIEIEDPKADVLYKRGIAKIFMGKIIDGCSDFKTSLDLGYTDAEKAIKKYCE